MLVLALQFSRSTAPVDSAWLEVQEASTELE